MHNLTKIQKIADNDLTYFEVKFDEMLQEF
mgnify:CR=1 FL=1